MVVFIVVSPVVLVATFPIAAASELVGASKL
jgi:hypothetical protein